MKKSNEELINLFYQDNYKWNIWKVIDYNKVIYYDKNNNDTSIIVIGLDGKIYKLLREVSI